MVLAIGSSKLRTSVALHGGGLEKLQLKFGSSWVDVCQNGTLARPKLNRRALLIMTPWTTRIFQRAFPWSEADGFASQEMFLLEAPWHKHALHGYGNQLPWVVTGRGPDRAVVELDSRKHKGVFVYPSDLLLKTEYRVEETTLIVRHTIKNIGKTRAPVSGGSHLFNAKCPGGQMSQPEVQFNAPKLWVPRTDTGGEAIPSGELAAVSKADDFSVAHVPEERYDNTFGEWDGTFTARTEDIGLQFQTRDCSPVPAKHINFWFDKNRGTYAGEPVIGIPDGFNLAAKGIDTGVRILEPDGESVFEHRHSWTRI